MLHGETRTLHCVQVQRVGRGMLGRLAAKRYLGTIVFVQRWWRGLRVRWRFNNVGDNLLQMIRNHIALENHAIRLQKIWRRYRQREIVYGVRNLRYNAEPFQLAWRRHVAWKDVQARREERAASRIQRLYRKHRGQMFRDLLKKRKNEAARRIQRWIRNSWKVHAARKRWTWVRGKHFGTRSILLAIAAEQKIAENRVEEMCRAVDNAFLWKHVEALQGINQVNIQRMHLMDVYKPHAENLRKFYIKYSVLGCSDAERAFRMDRRQFVAMTKLTKMNAPHRCQLSQVDEVFRECSRVDISLMRHATYKVMPGHVEGLINLEMMLEGLLRLSQHLYPHEHRLDKRLSLLMKEFVIPDVGAAGPLAGEQVLGQGCELDEQDLMRGVLEERMSKLKRLFKFYTKKSKVSEQNPITCAQWMHMSGIKECNFPGQKLSFMTCLRVFLVGSSGVSGALQNFYDGADVRESLVQILTITMTGWLNCLTELALRLPLVNDNASSFANKPPHQLVEEFLDKVFRTCPHQGLKLVDN